MGQGKVILGVLLLAGLVAALAPSVGEVAQVGPMWARLRPVWLLAAVGCQGLVYVCLAGILRAGLGPTGHRLPLPFLVSVSFVFLFANRALPGPAVAGLATLVFLLGRRRVPAAAAQAGAAAFYVADYISFFAFALLALGLLLRTTRLAALHPALLGTALAVIILVALMAFGLLRSPVTLRRAAVRSAGWIGRRRPDPRAFGEEAGASVDAFFARWQEITARRRTLAAACGWGLAMHGAEALTLVCCARAFGVRLPFGLAAAGYVTGNLAAIVSFLPGGVGFYEGAMVTTWHTAGRVPLGAALAVTLLYRLLSVWLPLPFALRAVRQALGRAPSSGPS